MQDRDIENVRLVGNLAFGLGIVLTFFTILMSIFLVLRFSLLVNQNYSLTGLLQLLLTMTMALTLASCGSQLRRQNPLTGSEIESLRLNWTALFVVTFFIAIVGSAILPPLAALAVFILTLLLLIRNAVIRLSGN